MLSRLVFLFSIFTLVTTASFAQSDLVEGIDVTLGQEYQLVTPPLPGGRDGKVEVVELFWYGCPHCDRFEPLISEWRKTAADYIEFSHLPAIFNNPQWRLHAQTYYAAESMGINEKLHTPLFDALHRTKQPLTTNDNVFDFVASHGVDRKAFKKAFKSFSVKAKVARAADLTRRYGISGVPVFIVNGKYRIDGPMAKSYENLLKIVDFLAEKEHNAAI
jgi:protein dithiol oxidoreductase (disulfide-forming)